MERSFKEGLRPRKGIPVRTILRPAVIGLLPAALIALSGLGSIPQLTVAAPTVGQLSQVTWQQDRPNQRHADNLTAHQQPDGSIDLLRGDTLRAGLIDIALSSDVVPGGEVGEYDLWLFTLSPGTSREEFRQQLALAFGGGPGAGQAVAWIEDHATIYGGLTSDRPDRLRYQVVLDEGRYFLADLPQLVESGFETAHTIDVFGDARHARLPGAGQAVTMTVENRFSVWPGDHHQAPKLHNGRLRISNMSHDQHFAEFRPVSPGVTDRDIQEFFDSGFTGPRPFRDDGESLNVGVISPGVEINIYLELPKDRYALLCFIPNLDGAPHALMGMHRVVRV